MTRSRALILSLFIGICSIPIYPQTTFTRITTSPVVSDGGNSHGSAWGDYDNDGDLDIFVMGTISSGISSLYRNDESGTFTLVTYSLFEAEEDGYAVWEDYDNDGGGTFTNIPAGLTGISSSAVAWGDYYSEGTWLCFCQFGNRIAFYITTTGTKRKCKRYAALCKCEVHHLDLNVLSFRECLVVSKVFKITNSAAQVNSLRTANNNMRIKN